MNKEILLYSPIYSYSAADFIEQLEASKDDEITIRMNCPGGDVYAAYGMISKYAEHPGSKKIKVDGQAMSGGFFMCCYAEDVECLDVSEFMAHRAAYPSWVENDPERFTEEAKAQLNRINANLRKGIEAKISADVFQSVTGTSLDDMFSLDKRIDVNISAQQAKQMGLVKKVKPLTSDIKKEIEVLSATHNIAAFSKPITIQTQETTHKVMTAEQIKAAHPEVYAQIMKKGADDERERVNALMVYVDVDPEAIAKAVKEGTSLTPTMMAEFGRKMFAKQGLENITSDNPGKIKTSEVQKPKTENEQQVEAFNKEVADLLKKNKNY